MMSLALQLVFRQIPLVFQQLGYFIIDGAKGKKEKAVVQTETGKAHAISFITVGGRTTAIVPAVQHLKQKRSSGPLERQPKNTTHMTLNNESLETKKKRKLSSMEHDTEVDNDVVDMKSTRRRSGRLALTPK
mmetsp:Transcript_16390/g.24707  ORF Transcript_16390/g.24707 Transcript_16390/m.24707 type:complete len:132 (+) Transcript_16390:713-1108(+)